MAFHALSGKTILVIPKGHYVTLANFLSSASQKEKDDFWRLVQHVVTRQSGDGKLLIVATHIGPPYQTVPHFHLRLEGV